MFQYAKHRIFSYTVGPHVPTQRTAMETMMRHHIQQGMLCLLLGALGCNLSSPPLNNLDNNVGTPECTPESDAQLCDTIERECTIYIGVDKCGEPRNVVCDTCTGTDICDTETQTCISCAAADFCTISNAECGELSSESNPTMQDCNVQSVGCGACEEGFACTDNACVAENCTREVDAVLCGVQGKQCGTHDLTGACGQSAQANCGACDEGTCEDGICSVCQAETDAIFCARLNTTCGPATGMDNCLMERTVDDCGVCAATEQCTAGACECVPRTPAQLEPQACAAKMCGATMAQDGCGAMVQVSCGTCQSTQTCFQDQCCAPIAPSTYCATQGFTCGEYVADDGCGSMITAQCGGCSDYLSCVSGGCMEITRTVNRAHFGRSVAVEGGNIIVGAARNANSGSQPGSIHLYQLSNAWSTALVQDALWPYMGGFGWSVGIYNDSIAVGAPAQGKVLGYTFTSSTITQRVVEPGVNVSRVNYGFDTASGLGTSSSGYTFGTDPTHSFNSSNNGSRRNVGSIVAHKIASTWIKANENFISRKPEYNVNETFVGITGDVKAKVRAFGAPVLNEVIIDKAVGSVWQQSTIITRTESGFGIRVDLSPNGRFLAVTQRATTINDNTDFLEDYPAQANHKVFVFENTSGDTWSEVAEFEDTANLTSQFGYDVAMGDEDLFVGMPGAGAFRHYKKVGSTWTLQGTKTASGNFGYALDFDGRILAVTRHTTSGGTLHIYDFQ